MYSEQWLQGMKNCLNLRRQKLLGYLWPMKAVIFDMDGLLIDSEPFWQEAGAMGLLKFGIRLTSQQQFTAIGLRTEEWVDHWFHIFKISPNEAPHAVDLIMNKALQLIDENAVLFPGAIDAIKLSRRPGLKLLLPPHRRLVLLAYCNKNWILILNLTPFPLPRIWPMENHILKFI